MDESTCEECRVVAGKAQLFLGCFQQVGIGAVMVLVTLPTIALLNRRVQRSGLRQVLGELLMAAEAHPGSFDMKKCASDQAMPPVTAGAVTARHRLVDDPLVELITVLFVAVKTGFAVTGTGSGRGTGEHHEHARQCCRDHKPSPHGFTLWTHVRPLLQQGFFSIFSRHFD
jgi:hypothetical protein